MWTILLYLYKLHFRPWNHNQFEMCRIQAMSLWQAKCTTSHQNHHHWAIKSNLISKFLISDSSHSFSAFLTLCYVFMLIYLFIYKLNTTKRDIHEKDWWVSPIERPDTQTGGGVKAPNRKGTQLKHRRCFHRPHLQKIWTALPPIHEGTMGWNTKKYRYNIFRKNVWTNLWYLWHARMQWFYS